MEKKSIDTQVKVAYDSYANEYFVARVTGNLRNRVNNFTELPAMINSVIEHGGNKNQFHLDVGCGPGIHAKEYQVMGGTVFGIDQSNPMIEIAKQNSPLVEFEVGTVYNLPFKDNSFDIVTASLMMFHLDHFDNALQEVRRVLKPQGIFHYSDLNSLYLSREHMSGSNESKLLFGHTRNKITGEVEVYGNTVPEGSVIEVPFMEGSTVPCYKRTFASHVSSLTNNGFCLVGYRDAFPLPEFERVRPNAYQILSKVPPYAIYSARVLG